MTDILDVISLLNKRRLIYHVCSSVEKKSGKMSNLGKDEPEQFIYSIKVLKQIFSSSTKISVNILFPIVYCLLVPEQTLLRFGIQINHCKLFFIFKSRFKLIVIF